MDLATLIGIVLGFGLVIGAMALGGSVSAFFNVPGVLIVLGGTFAATFIMEKMKNVLSAFRVLMNVFFDRGGPLEDLVPVITELATKARKEGPIEQ